MRVGGGESNDESEVHVTNVLTKTLLREIEYSPQPAHICVSQTSTNDEIFKQTYMYVHLPQQAEQGEGVDIDCPSVFVILS